MKKVFWLGSLILVLLTGQICRADTLQQVVIVTRHGVRAPTWTPEKLQQYSVGKWTDFDVPPGNLTVRGHELMKIMGGYYRDFYSASGLLDNSNCDNADRIYFYADTDQRTLETARALSEGMLPGCQSEIHSKAPGVDDPLFNAVDAGIAKPAPDLSLAAVQGRIGPQLDALLSAYQPAFQKLQFVLNGNGKAPKSIFDEPVALRPDKGNIAMTGALSLASTFTENLLLEYANGFDGEQFGWGRLTAADLEQLMILHTAYADLMRQTPYLAQARGSNLLSHIVRTMEQSAKGKTLKGSLGSKNAKIVVIVGHDTNISNLSGMLNLSWILPSYQPNDAPPGGALIFSLWKTVRGDYSIRLQFTTQTLEQMHGQVKLTLQNPPVTANLFIPSCSIAQDGYPCAWKDFRRTMNDMIDPKFVEKQR